jgi:hypothetical protein
MMGLVEYGDDYGMVMVIVEPILFELLLEFILLFPLKWGLFIPAWLL